MAAGHDRRDKGGTEWNTQNKVKQYPDDVGKDGERRRKKAGGGRKEE